MAQKDMDQRINSNSFGGEILGHFTFLFFFCCLCVENFACVVKIMV